jgi:hypothetical protein
MREHLQWHKHRYLETQADNPAAYYQKQLQLAQRTRNQLAESQALHHLGQHYLNERNYAEAEAHFHRALLLAQKIGDVRGEIYTLTCLSKASTATNGTLAVDYLLYALRLNEGLTDPLTERELLAALGQGYRALGDDARAADYFQRAYAFYGTLEETALHQALPIDDEALTEAVFSTEPTPLLNLHITPVSPQEARSVPLPVEPVEWVVGRSSSQCQLCIPDNRVSRVHFRLSYDPEAGVVLTDMHSSHGTLLDGVRLPPQEPTAWEPGQVVVVGRSELLLADG